MSTNVHLIQYGETLTGIARKYGTTIQELMALNGNKIQRGGDLIFAGDTLQLPVDSFEKTSGGEQQSQQLQQSQQSQSLQNENANQEEQEQPLTEEEKAELKAFASGIRTSVNFNPEIYFGNPDATTEEVAEEETATGGTEEVATEETAAEEAATEGTTEGTTEETAEEMLPVTQASSATPALALGAGALFVAKPYTNLVVKSLGEVDAARRNFTTTRATQKGLIQAAENELLKRQGTAARLQKSAKTAAKTAKAASKAVPQATSAATREMAAAAEALNRANATGNAAEIRNAQQAYAAATNNATTSVQAAANKAVKSKQTAQNLAKSAATSKTKATAAKKALKATSKTATKTVAKAAGTAVKAGTKVLGAVSVVLVPVMEGVALYSAKQEGEEAFAKQKKKSAVVATCTAAGAAAGAWFFGIGAVPGAGVGAVVGEVITWFM